MAAHSVGAEMAKWWGAAVLVIGAAQAGTIMQEASEDWARIAVPGMDCVLANNVWDRKQVPEGFSQSVFLESRDGKILPGWRWNAPGRRSSVLSMPELICGNKPWDAAQTLRREFSFRPGEKRLQADFDVEVAASGRYNMTFTLWAVTKLPAVKANISHEITIWNANAGMKLPGEKLETLTIGGRPFDLYVTPQGMITGQDSFTWTLVSFVAQTPLLKGTLDFGPFIDVLVQRNILTRAHSLTSLELGDEVAEGTGRVTVKQLDLRLR
jgi:hypothetical protein